MKLSINFNAQELKKKKKKYHEEYSQDQSNWMLKITSIFLKSGHRILIDTILKCQDTTSFIF